MDEFAFYNKTTALRIGLTPTSTLTSSNTTLPGNLTLPGPLVFSGTSSGTNLQLINATTISSGTTTTLAYAAFGVTPGTALERYALNAHRWWTGSTGTTSGTIGMQLSSTGLTVAGMTVSGGVSATALALTGTSSGTNSYALTIANGNMYLGGSMTAPATGFILSGGGGIIDDGLVSIQYTAPNLSLPKANTNYYATWTVNTATSKYPSTVVPSNLVDGNGQINIPTSGLWRIVVDFYYQTSSQSPLSYGAYASYSLQNKTVAGVPSNFGYLAMQMVYEQYFTGSSSISKGVFVANYSGTIAANLVMNITRTSR